MVALGQGIEDEAKAQGIKVNILDANGNSQTQLTQIEDSISKKVDAIILSPNNSDELVPGVKKANDAGIPVITVDSLVSKGADVAVAVHFDNEAGGAMAAKYIQDIYKSGKVLENQGAQGAYHATMRGNGFFNQIGSDSNFEVIRKDCQWSAENAQTITADVVTANSDLKAIMSHNGEMARGIIAGLKQLGKLKKVGEEGHIGVVAVDGTPIELQQIRDGEQDASINQDPLVMGSTALKAAADFLNGKAVEKDISTPPSLITKENVDDPQLWGNKFSK
ncbi:MAG: sugar ABC transporter substrate-binding protein [Ruminiclostridium sp.]